MAAKSKEAWYEALRNKLTLERNKLARQQQAAEETRAYIEMIEAQLGAN